MPRVVHFEIHAEEPERAVKFYRNTFAWEITKWEGPQPYWLVKTGPDGQPGINGGILKRPCPIDGRAVIAYVCTIDVPSVDDYAKQVQKGGGTVEMPKMAIPGIGWLAYCKDTEGNIFGLMQPDKGAA
jgi:predicted enzyme related to lactoylglutathione lyase